MESLLNDWIQLFDEKHVSFVQNEPNELRMAALLFLSIQKEFKRVETLLGNKLEILKATNDEVQTEKNYNIEVIESSPPKENIRSPLRKTSGHISKILESPTFSRHRKLNKKNKSLNASNILSEIIPFKNKLSDSSYTPKLLALPRKNLTDAIEDEDIFESSIIGVTPNLKVTKKPKNKSLIKKKLNCKNSSSNPTLTQIFSEMNTKKNDVKDESSMMDIDEILQKIDNEKTIDPDHSKSRLQHIKISSFVNDYDKIPERQKSPKKKFVYKETIRGNERKKLKGWSCKDCEQFYKLMNLSESELERKMNECSKHRSKFKPDEETIPGYWDMSLMPTPEDQKTQVTSSTCQDTSKNHSDLSFSSEYLKTESISSQSTQNSPGNNSTIFCFYKK